MSTAPGSKKKTTPRKQKQVVMRCYVGPTAQRSRTDQPATSTEQHLNKGLIDHLREIATDAHLIAHHAAQFERHLLRLCGRTALPMEFVASRSGVKP